MSLPVTNYTLRGFYINVPAMPEPMMAMSHVEGREAVERRLLYLCGWESQYEGTGLGTGRMRGAAAGMGGGDGSSMASLVHASSTRRKTMLGELGDENFVSTFRWHAIIYLSISVCSRTCRVVLVVVVPWASDVGIRTFLSGRNRRGLSSCIPTQVTSFTTTGCQSRR